MKSTIKKIIRTNKVLGADFEKWPNDVMLVSYPKSGITWMRFLIGNLISTEEITFHNVNNYVPDIYKTKQKELANLSSPRILKSHEPFDKDYGSIIHLVRDPRSVAVSNFFYHKKIGLIKINTQFKDYFSPWLKGQMALIGNWQENVGSWILAREGKSNYKRIRYEDLKKDTEKFLEDINQAIFNSKFTNEQIKSSIKSSSFDQMKNLKESLNEEGNNSIPFVRKAQDDEWKKYFTLNMEKKLIQEFKPVMEYLNYELT